MGRSSTARAKGAKPKPTRKPARPRLAGPADPHVVGFVALVATLGGVAALLDEPPPAWPTGRARRDAPPSAGPYRTTSRRRWRRSSPPTPRTVRGAAPVICPPDGAPRRRRDDSQEG